MVRATDRSTTASGFTRTVEWRKSAGGVRSSATGKEHVTIDFAQLPRTLAVDVITRCIPTGRVGLGPRIASKRYEHLLDGTGKVERGAPHPIPARVPPAADSRSPVTPPAGVASADLAPPRRTSWVGGGIAAGAVVLAAAGVLVWQRRNPPDGAVMTVAPSTTAPNDSASPAATPSSRPRPAGKGVARAPAVDSSIKPSVVVERPSAALEENRRARADLDRVKSALADPDAVGAAGNGDAILQDIRRLLPRLVARQDSVEATYYAIETNLILDRPADACRLLLQVRSGSRGTEFEGRVERFLADTALGCANRR